MQTHYHLKFVIKEKGKEMCSNPKIRVLGRHFWSTYANISVVSLSDLDLLE